jgi:large subunit ribosomal protein L30
VRLRITQVRSQIGTQARHRGTLRALGLRRIGQTVEHEDSPQLQGMLRLVARLVRVEPIDTTSSSGSPALSAAGPHRTEDA